MLKSNLRAAASNADLARKQLARVPEGSPDRYYYPCSVVSVLKAAGTPEVVLRLFVCNQMQAWLDVAMDMAQETRFIDEVHYDA